jgi:gas vesicle protein
MKSGKVLLGAIAGVAAGAVLGLLFAPAKGSATIKRVARKVSDSAEDVQENLNEYIDATSEEYNTVKKGAMDLVDKAKKNAATVVRAIHSK